MTELRPVQGELQSQILPTLWRLQAGTVEQVRAGLPERYRSAYTTVQTVLNRLADRGLLSRERRGNAIVYRPTITEAEYLTRSVDQTLAGASREARQVVLAGLVGSLEEAELDELRALASRVADPRRRSRR